MGWVGVVAFGAMAAIATPPPKALPPCPATPNCVSSQAAEGSACWIAPLPLAGPPDRAMARLAGLIEAMPGSRVTTRQSGYLEAEFRSRLFGFVDDLALQADAAAGVVHVRSASRAGRWDLGVNRRRVETLRARYLASD